MKTRPPAIEADEDERTLSAQSARSLGDRWPHLVQMSGTNIGQALRLDEAGTLLGRGNAAHIRIADSGVSRVHAKVWRDPTRDVFVLEDLGSANGTLVNGLRVHGAVDLSEGDKIQIGATTVFRYTLFDSIDETYHRQVGTAMNTTGEWHVTKVTSVAPQYGLWSIDSWRRKKMAQAVEYDDPDHVARVITKLRRLPPLVTSWEIEDLRRQLAEAEDGRRFVLQGGDCAETHSDCESSIITNKLKILIQMSLVLIRGGGRPVTRVGRFAGQYAKPRSKPTETRDGVELRSYLGDLVNRPEFTEAARKPDPELLLESYYHSALTLNFVRCMSNAAFSDLRRSEHFDLSYFERAELPPSLKMDYKRLCREMNEQLQFLRAVGDSKVADLFKVAFFSSHEGLNLHYESAQTRAPAGQTGFYNLSTHMPWIGERTRDIDGAHVEFFRGIRNPVGLKVGPNADPQDIVTLSRVLNPMNEKGKLVLITRLGASNVERVLPRLIEAMRERERSALWICDPMHGNTITTATGVKTRNFDDILADISTSMDVHEANDSYCGGVHFELTGEDVTECLGGGIEEKDLARNYGTACDPRLNYRQAIQMAFCVADRLKRSSRPPTIPPPPNSRG